MKEIAWDGIPRLFSDKQNSEEKRNSKKLIDELYRQIDQLKVENDRVKQGFNDKKRLIGRNHPLCSIKILYCS